MEWTMCVNQMLTDEITKLNHTLIPPGFNGDVRSVRVMQESLAKLIDMLGEQSATAQGLSKVITTSEKLRNSPTHTLYLLKDSKAKGGNGEVIGMLKVGRKHLFLYDEREQVREVEPLCVLDFFVLPDRQRHGYGRVLFDHMLKDTEMSAQQLAVDGPSAKMGQFLSKNYGVDRLLRQNNNFAVSPQFFDNTADVSSKSGCSTPSVAAAVGRFAAPKPHSSIASVIHGGGGSCHHETANGAVSNGITPEGEPEASDQPEAEAPAEPEPPVEHKSPERPSSLQVEPAVAAVGADTEAGAGAEAEAGAIVSPAGSTVSRRDSQLTERGFFDVKFYHNKLW